MHTLQRERSSQRLAACVTRTTQLVQPQWYPVCPGRTWTSPSQETGDQFIPTGQNLASQIMKSRHPFPFFQWNSMSCSKRFLSYCLDSFINKFFMGKKTTTLQQIQKLKKILQRIFLKIRESEESSKSVRWCRLPWWLVKCWSCIKELKPITPTVVHRVSQSNSIFQEPPPKSNFTIIFCIHRGCPYQRLKI